MNINDIFSVKEKQVVITGCGSGMGLELAKGFINNGAHVIGISRSKPKENVVFSDFFECDVTDNNKILSMVDKIRLKDIKINVLLNVAGITVSQSDVRSEISRFDDTFNTNIRAMFQIINEFKPFLSSGSSIINFSSIGAQLGFPQNPSYCASKGAVSSLSRAFANDFGAKNIRVNCIVPGYFYTKMTSKSFLNKKEKKIREQKTMLGRWGEVKELLGAAIFLASDASSYVTGSELVVDGGWSSKGL
jgi:NAD(P)-dependent dehydrogenase (short-subunit alcohol dehydrogenase family)|tara:strand:+ start:1603 stop:2343 length:741 start_codon:yes stop_codon:yes gene_type:complete